MSRTVDDSAAAKDVSREALTRMVDELPGGEYLIMDVLAARHRLGEGLWTFPSRLRPSLRQLEAKGLIWWKSGSVEHTCMAGLTDNGRTGVLSPTYVPPNVTSDQETERLHDQIAELSARLDLSQTALRSAAAAALVEAAAAVVANASELRVPRGYSQVGVPVGVLLGHLQEKTENLQRVLADGGS